ncbi:hypothetical protein ABK040_007728 [Willaertia magna]
MSAHQKQEEILLGLSGFDWKEGQLIEVNQNLIERVKDKVLEQQNKIIKFMDENKLNFLNQVKDLEKNEELFKHFQKEIELKMNEEKERKEREKQLELKRKENMNDFNNQKDIVNGLQIISKILQEFTIEQLMNNKSDKKEEINKVLERIEELIKECKEISTFEETKVYSSIKREYQFKRESFLSKFQLFKSKEEELFLSTIEDKEQQLKDFSIINNSTTTTTIEKKDQKTITNNNRFDELLDYSRNLFLSNKNIFFYELIERKEKKGNLESLFYFPACKVSKGIVQLIEKLDKFIEKVVVETNNNIKEEQDKCVKVIQQVVQLYLLFIPQLYKEELDKMIQFPMILFNDCMLLSHQLDIYSTALVNDSGNSGMNGSGYNGLFIIANELRDFAERERIKLLKQQENELIIFLDEIKGFCDVIQNEKKITKSISKILNQLDHCFRVWKEVFTNGTFYISIGQLINFVMNRICKELLVLKEIGANESEIIHQSMSLIYEWTFEHFKEIPSQKKHLFIPMIYKYYSIQSIMNMSLNDITKDYCYNDRLENNQEDKKLKDLTSLEITNLIKALFEETQKRREAIQLILTTTNK